MEKFTKADVIFTISAGNGKPPSGPGEKVVDVSTYPQLLASDYPMIVVGSVDTSGRNSPTSMGGPLVSVMAPGVRISCGANSWMWADQTTSGTSFGESFSLVEYESVLH